MNANPTKPGSLLVINLADYILSKAKPYKSFEPKAFAKEYLQKSTSKGSNMPAGHPVISETYIVPVISFMENEGYIREVGNGYS